MKLEQAIELRKARTHKYIRKEGKRYIYKESSRSKKGGREREGSESPYDRLHQDAIKEKQKRQSKEVKSRKDREVVSGVFKDEGKNGVSDFKSKDKKKLIDYVASISGDSKAYISDHVREEKDGTYTYTVVHI